MEIFEISDDYIELYKLLKALGLCESGATSKAAVNDGDVTVDGKIETRKRCKVFPESVVEYLGQKIIVKKIE